MLYDNKEHVFWPRVPYARQVRAYLNEVEEAARAQLEEIEARYKVRVANELLKLFSWFQQDHQSKTFRDFLQGLK